MRRSEINAIVADAEAFIRGHGFALPPFAAWGPERWAKGGAEARELASCAMGWDITDFGSGEFARRGLVLFTMRNGRPGDPASRPYAEKIMVVGEGQVTPLHFHWRKVEDIIVRGGGRLVVQLYASTPDERLADGPVTVMVDGAAVTVPAGGTVEIGPGQSVTLVPGVYHAFWASGGRALVGEVSSINDDATDNRFFERAGRFPAIDEDEAPRVPLVGDYAALVPQG